MLGELDGVRLRRESAVLRQLVAHQRVTEAGARLRKKGGDVPAERAGGVQPLRDGLVGRVGIVVEQQNDAHRRELLQGSGQQRHPHDLRLLGVRGDEDGDRRLALREVAVQLRAGNPHVLLEPLERTLTGDQVHQRGERQEGDDDQVADGLHREPEVLRAEHEELADDRGDHVDRPEEHGRDDGDAAPGDLAVGGLRVDGGKRLSALLSAELAFSGRGV